MTSSDSSANTEARLQLAGDLHALAAFSEPDAAETLRRAADILERTAGALKLAIDHAQRAHDQSALAASYHNNSDACTGGNYMSIHPLPPWFAETSAVLSALTTDGSRPDPDEDGPGCTNPGGHSWVFTGTAYGGDDERWHGEGRCYCEHCGADGDG